MFLDIVGVITTSKLSILSTFQGGSVSAIETGINFICCICMELKAKSSYSSSSTISKDELVNTITISTSVLSQGQKSCFIQYATFTLRYQFLHFFSVKIFIKSKTQWQFKNLLIMTILKHPYMLTLIKYWLRYLRLKTIDIFQKSISFHLFHCQFSLLFLH